ARRLGFETLYWGEAFDRKAWRALEEVIADGRSEGRSYGPVGSVRVSFIGVAKEAPEFLQQHGYLTRDFIPVRPGAPEADYLVVARSEGWLAREGLLHLLEPKAIEEAVFVRRHLGVPLCWILSQEATPRSTVIEAVR
ncbi:MAG: hypothetical protein KAX80_06595, partial [Planctomycetes bacterium]|nr:hypothetical protein [Planctomycetota bacterium]